VATVYEFELTPDIYGSEWI